MRIASGVRNLAVSVTFSPCVYATPFLSLHPPRKVPPTIERIRTVSTDPRQEAFTTAAVDGIVRDAGFSNSTLPVPAAALTLRNLKRAVFSRHRLCGRVFRLFPLPPGRYESAPEAMIMPLSYCPSLHFCPMIRVPGNFLVNAATAEARPTPPRLPESAP